MRAKLTAGWREALSGFWFVPGVVALLIAALAFPFVEIDRAFPDVSSSVGFGGDASAARDLLAVIAGSLITVAGISFSLTMVTMQLVASQFSPRALRGLLADRPRQIVVGIFVGVFAYCLLVMRTVRTGDPGDTFVPGLAVTLAIVLALITLGALVYFIHHVGKTIQVSEIAADIGKRAGTAIERFAPSDGVDEGADPIPTWEAEGIPAHGRVSRAGFVQSIDTEAFVRCLPDDYPLRVQVVVKPGDFVTESDDVLRIWPAQVSADEIDETVRQAIVVGNERDDGQDPGYPLRLLADIALRALSPSTNDPTTAVTAIGYIRNVLERAAQRPDPVRIHELDDGRITAVVSRWKFADLVDEALGELPSQVEMGAAQAFDEALDSVEREAATGPDLGRVATIQRLRRD